MALRQLSALNERLDGMRTGSVQNLAPLSRIREPQAELLRTPSK